MLPLTDDLARWFPIRQRPGPDRERMHPRRNPWRRCPRRDHGGNPEASSAAQVRDPWSPGGGSWVSQSATGGPRSTGTPRGSLVGLLGWDDRLEAVLGQGDLDDELVTGGRRPDAAHPTAWLALQFFGAADVGRLDPDVLGEAAKDLALGGGSVDLDLVAPIAATACRR